MKIIKKLEICGILSAIAFFACILLSYYFSSWFNWSWTENYISNFGGLSSDEKPIWAARGLSSIIFNAGIAFSGLLGIIFLFTVRKKTDIFNTRSGNIGITLGSLNMLALSGIGVFPITLFEMHAFCSRAFFMSIPVVLIFITFYTRNIFEKKWWWMMNILSITSVCSIGMFMFTPHLTAQFGKAVAEVIISCPIFIFFIALSIKLLNIDIRIIKTNMKKISVSCISLIGLG